MICPIDSTEMVIGSLTLHGYAWRKGKPLELPNQGILSWGRPKFDPVTAWRCPKCGKIELQVDEKFKDAL